MSRGRGRTATFEVTVELSPAEAFDFFSEVGRLNEVTPPWFTLHPTAAPPRGLSVGAVVDYRFRWRWMRLRWRSRITDWRPPSYFAYEQERGPYRFFRHEHYFDPAPGGTRVTDVVIFRTLAGATFDRRLVAPELGRVFAYRSAYARRLFPIVDARGTSSTVAAGRTAG